MCNLIFVIDVAYHPTIIYLHILYGYGYIYHISIKKKIKKKRTSRY
nr:MAG TPA: hypothetical protein [Caudoviricetes sp.]